MLDYEIANLLRNAVHIHKTSYFEHPYIEATEFGYRMTDAVASIVLDAKDRMDEAFMMAMSEQFERNKIGTAIIFDIDYIKRLIVRCDERHVYDMWCPCCGADLDPHLNENYCGKCGQKITWKEDIKQ